MEQVQLLEGEQEDSNNADEGSGVHWEISLQSLQVERLAVDHEVRGSPARRWRVLRPVLRERAPTA
jgi:hypothetical protein